MEFDDFWDRYHGWSDGLLYEQSLVRKSTLIIASAMGAKKDQLEKAWQDPYEKRKVMETYGGMEVTSGQARLLKLLKGQKRKRKTKNG